ncbi:hypothetical protein VF21_02058 [Pseudogymnoascus sp. 05NY08]|nr:hypothetical protein VF21_02058 [Pseudogymnoascus sp. 05NY08]
MGKPLNLGKKLKYPITVNKLLKSPGDSFAKGDAIFEYSFKWKKEVGDAFGDKWEEEITTIVSFASTADGKLLRWQIRPGMVINNDQSCAEIDETCSHAVQYAGLCALCGKDMNETSWATDTVDAQRAQINMIHDQTLLSVSQDEASRAEEQLQRRLLKNRKLSLVVDLDQTIIHACIEPTIGEWQRDPTSPNYEAVKDVKSFQLHDDGPRGLASGCWYYIKMRPGLAHFLATIAEKYELHVYTMGTRAYAQEIAKIVDPEHKLFGDRIISRDENGSLTAKTLSRLFPVDTKMVVIIDDRADVWPRNRSNLIKVVPYDFFIGIGDINSSFLPKREETPKVAPALPPMAPMPDTEEAAEAVEEGTAEGEAQDKRHVLKSKATSTDTTESMSALEELVAMGGGDDPTVREIQAQEQAEFLEKQLKERPLLHMQQQLDKEDNAEGEEAANGTAEESEHTDDSAYNHHRHHLLKDDDNELAYLENHLLGLHRTFYEQYDRALINAKGDRVAHLRPGATKKVHMKDEAADLQIVPDIGEVMPLIKSNSLRGTSIVLSGLVPLGVDVLRYLHKFFKKFMEDLELAFDTLKYKYMTKQLKRRSEIAIQSMSFGAQIHTKISRKVTHLVVAANRTRTQKVRQATSYPHIKIVNQQWLVDSMSRWERVDETPYLINIDREDKSAQPELFSDGRSLDDSSGDDSGGEGHSSHDDADMPDDFEGGQSPIEGLKDVDWSGVDAELEEFMASGSESDSESVASNTSDRSQQSTISIRRKRKLASTKEGEEADEESNISKKQRLARNRTTGLKTVKTPNSASGSSLPTPEKTAAEDGDEMHQADTQDEEEFDNDLEAEMMAEFEKGGWDSGEEGDGGGGGGGGGG